MEGARSLPEVGDDFERSVVPVCFSLFISRNLIQIFSIDRDVIAIDVQSGTDPGLADGVKFRHQMGR